MTWGNASEQASSESAILLGPFLGPQPSPRDRLGEAWPWTTSRVSACAALIRHNDLSLQGSHYSGLKVGVRMVGEGTTPKAASSRGARGGRCWLG